MKIKILPQIKTKMGSEKKFSNNFHHLLDLLRIFPFLMHWLQHRMSALSK